MKINNFTLADLLIVLSSIAILLILLLPTLNHSKKQADVRSCQSHLKQIILGWTLYCSEYERNPPIHENSGWDIYLSPYINRKCLLCPCDKIANRKNNNEKIQSYIFNEMLTNNHLKNILSVNNTIAFAERGDKTNILKKQVYPASENIQYWESYIKKDRHKNKSNYAFVDGHIELLTFKDTIGDSTTLQNMHYIKSIQN